MDGGCGHGFCRDFAKEVFGGTGYNIFNVALVARAFLFFAYPAQMSGDSVFVSHGSMLGVGDALADGFSCATPLGQIASATGGDFALQGIMVRLYPHGMPFSG